MRATRIAAVTGRIRYGPYFRFDRLGQDFIRTYGTEQNFGGQPAKVRAVLNHLEEVVGERDRRYLRSASDDVEYMDYDWTLNEQE